MNTNNKPQILFVDDDVFFANGYLEALDERYQVTIARNVPTAEQEVKTVTKHLCAVLDVMMPIPASWPDGDKIAAAGGALTGIIVLRRCKVEIVNAKLPVIVLTNRQPIEMEAEIANLGFPNGLVEIHHKIVTPAFMLPNLMRDIIKRIKNVTT